MQEFINDCWTMIVNRRNLTMYHVTIQISHQRRGCDSIVEDDEVDEDENLSGDLVIKHIK